MLNPLATPENRSSTAASTDAVSGATTSRQPETEEQHPGQYVGQYDASGPTPRSSSRPTAATTGPR